jgi:hypothetical protein
MALPKPKRLSLEQLLKLVDQLSPAEQEKLVEETKLKWLRQELTKAEISLNNGKGIPGEVVLEELRQSANDRLKKSK